MSERREWLYFSGIVFALCSVFCTIALFSWWTDRDYTTRLDACTEALNLADQRHVLHESTMSLTYDAWLAEQHDDQQAEDYANAGIYTNTQELEEINDQYDYQKDQCND